MDLITKVIQKLNLTNNEIIEIYNKTDELDLMNANDKIQENIYNKIQEKYELINNDIHIIVFLKLFGKERSEDLIKRIFYYEILINYNYYVLTPVQLIENIRNICSGMLFNYFEYCCYIVSQLDIPIGHIRFVCQYIKDKDYVINKMNECINKNSNIIDKLFCLITLKNLYFNGNKYFDMYFNLPYIKSIENEEHINEIKELGLKIVTDVNEDFFVEIIPTEPSYRVSGGYEILSSTERILKSKFNNIEINILNFQNSKTIYTEYEYIFLVLLYSENYDKCLEYYSSDMNKYLLTFGARILINVGNKEINDKIISFIIDSNFNIEIKIKFAYLFVNPLNIEYIQKAYDSFQKYYPMMIKSDIRKIETLHNKINKQTI